MKYILSVENGIVTVGDDANGEVFEINQLDCNFYPKVGDSVKLFKKNDRFFIIKEKENEDEKKININITNQNSQKVNLKNEANLNKDLKPVNQVIYLIIIFFFGWLGFHKFYAGRIGTGILYLIFSFTLITILLAFIDFFVALSKKADENGDILV